MGSRKWEIKRRTEVKGILRITAKKELTLQLIYTCGSVRHELRRDTEEAHKEAKQILTQGKTKVM